MRPDAPSAGKDFPQLPDGESIQVVVREATAGLEDNPFFGKKDAQGKVDNRKQVNRVHVVMETVDPEFKNARVWFNGSFSVNDRSVYRKLAVAAWDRDPADENELLDAADTDNLLGRQLKIVGEYPTRRDGTPSKYLSPKVFKRVARKDYIDSFEPAPAAAPESDDTSDEDISDF